MKQLLVKMLSRGLCVLLHSKMAVKWGEKERERGDSVMHSCFVSLVLVASLSCTSCYLMLSL